MNITNFTTFPAEITLSTDKTGSDSYLVVVKGTYDLPSGGEALPAKNQVPFFYGDQHFGEPETTSIRYESEFAPVKTLADVVLIGTAHTPGGKPARSVVVELRVEKLSKRIRVVGDRVWRSYLGIFAFPGAPKPFLTMPIQYERAFGGGDTTHKNPGKHRFDRRNMVGVGFQRGRSALKARGKSLPNLENPRDRLRRPGQKIRPASFGFLSRSWESRARYAGTYDTQWKENRFPLLPADFDERYFQGVPPDQMRPHFKGGEIVSLLNLSPEGLLKFRLPDLMLPVTFLFEGRREAMQLAADTLILEPDDHRFQVLWRARLPVRGKLLSLAEVLIGEPTPGRKRSMETGKRYLDWSAV